MAELLFKDESYKIIGSCMKFHSELGPGFSESVYQEALSIQFKKDEIPFEREKVLEVYFDGVILKKHFKADFVCFESIIVELKANSSIHSDNFEQTRNYLKSSKFKLGLLVNFGEKSLTYKRILN